MWYRKKDLNDKIRGLQSTTCPPNLNTTPEFNRLLDSGIKSGIEKYQQTTEQSLRLSSEINYLKRLGSEVQRALKIRIFWRRSSYFSIKSKEREMARWSFLFLTGNVGSLQYKFQKNELTRTSIVSEEDEEHRNLTGGP